ncbi:Nicotinic acid phosphoribosyltransferase, partial [Operophtera brumata]
MATNAARYRMVAGKNVSLLEFGLRRAQGPDGGLSASKYAYIAGKMFNIPVRGTHAHSFVTSFSSLADLGAVVLRHAQTQRACNLLELSTEWRARVSSLIDISQEEASDGELAALISYAIAFPSGFLALVDTYDVKRYNFQGLRHVQHNMNGHSGYNSNCGSNGTRVQNPPINSTYGISTVERTLRSGLLNFCAVALALNDCGYRAVGIRIDSGDLAYLSVLARDTFETVAEAVKLPWFAKLTIVASNDINEETILSLNEQGHKIDSFGIDLLQRSSEPPPAVGQKVLCRHPFQESKRAYVIPSKVEHLYKVRERVHLSLRTLRQDIKRNLNPTPYKCIPLVLKCHKTKDNLNKFQELGIVHKCVPFKCIYKDS